MLHEAIEALGLHLVTRPEDAGLVIHGDFGHDHRRCPGRVIHFSGENLLPDFTQCDAAITSALIDDPRHHRLPYWAFSCAQRDQLASLAPRDGEALASRHQGFCSFVASNPRAPERNRFFRALHRRRFVASAGRCFTTVERPTDDKARFLGMYRFNICFENTASPGYTTEKLVDALLAGTIPIYWGNPQVGLDFNPRAMIRAADFDDERALADHVIALAEDLPRCEAMLSEPFFSNPAQLSPLSVEPLRAALERFLCMTTSPRPLRWRARRLRSHCYRSPLHQTLVSAACRLDAFGWMIGRRMRIARMWSNREREAGR